ncbi:hypothetical protein SUGI_0854550 [Cryptomeria japonica]|uniref:heavy metal-associated isoprenylated plant protein 28 n=1 Tax=Cryptomeria japonica TaxID=3369 RepID=UPI002414A391|nr:heavy metal-associated isoprenylated plant protein 28 [Cryptomeria japonica]GLJ41280.1 hypothetical protein SUGI_0854550 [Cryptomeria japonica]
MEVVELQVRLHCKGCERTVRKALCKLKGVQTVDIEMSLHKITVGGYVDQKMVLKTVRKTGRRAELWPLNPHQPGHITTKSKTSHSLHTSSTYTKVYNNYRKHGYNGSFGYFKLADDDEKSNRRTLMFMLRSLARSFHLPQRRQ